MRIRRTESSEQAMVLTEAVIATGIIGIAAAALISSFTFGFATMQSVRENQRATQILIEKVETIRLYSWSQVNTPGFIPPTFSDFFDPLSAQGSSKGVEYHGGIQIQDVPFGTSYSTNMKEIEITLNWTSRNNITHTRTATTFLAKDGIQNYVY